MTAATGEGSVKELKKKVEGLGKKVGKESGEKVEGLGKKVETYADKVAQKAGKVIIMRPSMHGGYKK